MAAQESDVLQLADVKDYIKAELKSLSVRIDAMEKDVGLLSQYPTEVDKAVSNLKELHSSRFSKVEDRNELILEKIKALYELSAQIPVLTSGLVDIRADLERRVVSTRETAALALTASKEATALALASADKAIILSQSTADRAVAKAEAAADKELLEQSITSVNVNFREQIGALRESLAQQILAQKEAVSKAEHATEKRFEGVNEFRAQLQDQALRFMPRTESETLARAGAEKVDIIGSRLDRIEGRTAGFASSGSVVIGIVSVIAAIIGSTLAILAFNG